MFLYVVISGLQHKFLVYLWKSLVFQSQFISSFITLYCNNIEGAMCFSICYVELVVILDFILLHTGYLPDEHSACITHCLPASFVVMPKRHMTLNQKRKKGKFKKKQGKVKLFGNPQMRGIILKLVIRKPRKPNSAQRKCALVKLSNGKRVHAYIPGVGHNLQDHNIVLIQGGGPQDTPGVKYSIIRGKYDCAHVVRKQNN